MKREEYLLVHVDVVSGGEPLPAEEALFKESGILRSRAAGIGRGRFAVVEDGDGGFVYDLRSFYGSNTFLALQQNT